MAVCSVTDLLADAACFACTPEKLLATLRVALLCRINSTLDPMAVCDVEALLAEAKASGFLGKSMETLAVLETQILCNVNASISGGLVVGNQFSGNGDPNGVQVGSVGDIFMQLDGDGRLWSKVSGTATSTGWV